MCISQLMVFVSQSWTSVSNTGAPSALRATVRVHDAITSHREKKVSVNKFFHWSLMHYILIPCSSDTTSYTMGCHLSAIFLFPLSAWFASRTLSLTWEANLWLWACSSLLLGKTTKLLCSFVFCQLAQHVVFDGEFGHAWRFTITLTPSRASSCDNGETLCPEPRPAFVGLLELVLSTLMSWVIFVPLLWQMPLESSGTPVTSCECRDPEEEGGLPPQADLNDSSTVLFTIPLTWFNNKA